MKSKLYLLFIAGIAFIFSSCEGFLNKYPQDELTPGSYYNNLKELKTGLAGCYFALYDVYAPHGMTKHLELMSDDGKDPRNSDVFHIFRKTNANSVSAAWVNHYKMIYNCNAFLEVLDKYEDPTGKDKEAVDAMRGETLFLRALAYLNLTRLYGDVPKVTSTFVNPGDAFGIGRTSVNDIYTTVVIPDLEAAVGLCYKKGDAALSTEGARATKGSALMLLAKTHMTMGKYAEAQAVLKRMIEGKEGGEYGLMPSITDALHPNNKFNKEMVFEVNYSVAGGRPSEYYRILINDIGNKLGSDYNSAYQAEHNLMREFTNHNETVRYKATLDSGYVAGASPSIQAYPVKFAPPGSERAVAKQKKGTDYNFVVLRYADALLMYAECLMVAGDKTGALGYINQVRTRSQMDALPASHNLDIYWILHERRMELSFEGHRYFDLVRTGKAIEIISKALMTPIDQDDKPTSEPITENQLLLPIPVDQIEIDQTLIQNKGY